MKSTDLPEISEAWWKKNQPKTLGSNGLGPALRSYEDSRKAIEKMVDSKTIDRNAEDLFSSGEDALRKLDGAVDATVGKCSPTLHKECKAVLGRYAPLLKAEKVKLAAYRLSYDKYLGDRVKKGKAALIEVGKEAERRVRAIEKKLTELKELEQEFAELRGEVAASATGGKPGEADKTRKTMEAEFDKAKKLRAEIVAEAERTRDIVVELAEDNCDAELAQADKELRGLYERYEGKIAPADVAAEEAEVQFASIGKAKKATEALLDGQGNLREEWLDICEAQISKLHTRQELIAMQLANLAGEADQIWGDANNFVTEPDTRDPRTVAALRERLAALGNGVALRDKELTTAIGNFKRDRGKHPPFVAKDAEFKDIRDELATLENALRAHATELSSVKKKGVRARTEVDAADKASKAATV